MVADRPVVVHVVVEPAVGPCQSLSPHLLARRHLVASCQYVCVAWLRLRFGTKKAEVRAQTRQNRQK